MAERRRVPARRLDTDGGLIAMKMATQLYEQIMSLAIDLGHEAEVLRGTRTENESVQDEVDDEVAIAYEEVAGRLTAILNASPLADTEGSASSQHYIETGIRLPKGGTER